MKYLIALTLLFSLACTSKTHTAFNEDDEMHIPELNNRLEIYIKQDSHFYIGNGKYSSNQLAASFQRIYDSAIQVLDTPLLISIKVDSLTKMRYVTELKHAMNKVTTKKTTKTDNLKLIKALKNDSISFNEKTLDLKEFVSELEVAITEAPETNLAYQAEIGTSYHFYTKSQELLENTLLNQKDNMALEMYGDSFSRLSVEQALTIIKKTPKLVVK